MKKLLHLFLITATIPLVNYIFYDSKYIYYAVLVYSILLTMVLKIFKNKPILKFEFNWLFFEYLLYNLLLKVFLFIIFKFKINLNLPNVGLMPFTMFLIIPFFEELIFRVYFFEKLKEYSTKYIILISSLFFTLSHIIHTDSGLFYIYIHSVLISIYFFKTKNLLMVYLLHILLNLTTLFVV